ncbi:MAG: OprO/OprP family phosphate-selective porin [Prevotella sp.]|nr:OprO/OprP family phosphate-selective porin [Prevotella sp.]
MNFSRKCAAMLCIGLLSPIAMMAQEKSDTENVKDFIEDVSKRIQLHGYAQAGYTYQHKGGEETNTFDFKRAFLIANANITDRWSTVFMYDIGGKVQEYYTDYRLTNNKALSVRFGQFKNGLTMENRVSPTNSEVIDVCSESVTYLTGCGTDPLMGVQFGRDLGMLLYGEVAKGKLYYELGVMNGQGINQKDQNNAKDIIGRIEVRPAKGLNIVATGQLGKGHAIAPSIYNPDILPGQDYTRDRYSVGFDYKSRPFNVHGEYLEGKNGNTISRGAYITGSIAIVPNVFDIVGSYDYFNYNTDLNYDMHKAVFGVQWWYFKKCRFQVQYVYRSAYTTKTEFVHGANNAIMCQMQVRFN